jgi:hypothetical protein
MAWVIRGGKRYFYRSVRIDGRPSREYLGSGPSPSWPPPPEKRRAGPVAGHVTTSTLSPTQRGLALLRRRGYVVEKVEQRLTLEWFAARDRLHDLDCSLHDAPFVGGSQMLLAVGHAWQA